MLKRKAYDKLLEWKSQNKKKALYIIGARQIGKTTLIRDFGRQHYENFIEVNFVTDEGPPIFLSAALTPPPSLRTSLPMSVAS